MHENERAIPGAIKIDEKEIRDHLDGVVRQSVEETLNGLLKCFGRFIEFGGCYYSNLHHLSTPLWCTL